MLSFFGILVMHITCIMLVIKIWREGGRESEVYIFPYLDKSQGKGREGNWVDPFLLPL